MRGCENLKIWECENGVCFDKSIFSQKMLLPTCRSGTKHLNLESAPTTLKKENHGDTENTEEHRALLISTINFVKLSGEVP